jgi:hypothetical protein
MRKTISFDHILRSKDPEVDKLAQMFDAITRQYVTDSEHQLEVLQALGDDENRLKEQIKLGMMQHAREIFADSFRRVTGRKAWDE